MCRCYRLSPPSKRTRKNAVYEARLAPPVIEVSPNLGSLRPSIRAGPQKFTYRPKQWHIKAALKDAAAAATSEAKGVQETKPDAVRA